MSQEFWKEIDLAVNANKEFILTEEEAKLMAKIEQENYEKNLESIEKVLEYHLQITATANPLIRE